MNRYFGLTTITALSIFLIAPSLCAASHSLNDELLSAVKEGDLARTTSLLQRGAQANAHDADNVSALMLAAHSGEPTVVDALLSNGATVKGRDRWGLTVLGYVVEPSLLKKFIALGAKASPKDKGVLSDNLENTIWIDSDVEDEEVKAYTHLVLKAGADLNSRSLDEAKTTPLLNAVNSRPSVVRFLLDLGAKPNIADGDGQTPLMRALAPLGSPPPHSSSDAADDIVRLLLQRGADINQRDIYGVTALMSAARLGEVEYVRLFISHGANVNVQDKFGVTALMLAATRGSSKIAQLLLNAGAKPHLKDNKGGAALSRAQSNTIVIAGTLPPPSRTEEVLSSEDRAIMIGRHAIIEMLKANSFGLGIVH